MVSALLCGDIVKPEVNNSGRIIRSIDSVIEFIFSSK
jgi:hypothetical protein